MAAQEESFTPQLKWSKTIFVLTRIAWLRRGPKTVKALLAHPETAAIVSTFAKGGYHPLVRMQVQFLVEALAVATLEGDAKVKTLFELHRRKHQNAMFYCTKNEIAYGTLKRKAFDWEPILTELNEAIARSSTFIAEYLMPQMLRSTAGTSLVNAVRELEIAGKVHGDSPARTVAANTTEEEGDGYFLDLISRMLLDTEKVGIVVVDVLNSLQILDVNVGLERVTNHVGSEQVGKPYGFLNGPSTESNLLNEVNAAFGESLPRVFKLTQHKANGTPFQCLLALHPIFKTDISQAGAPQQSRYIVVTFLDMVQAAKSGKCSEMLAEFESVLVSLPTTITCDSAIDRQRLELEPIRSKSRIASMLYATALPESCTLTKAPAEASCLDTEICDARAHVDSKGRPVSLRRNDVKVIDYDSAASSALWLAKSEGVLKALLETEEGRASFGQFLEMEFNKPALDFYVDAVELKRSVDSGKVAPVDGHARARTLRQRYNAELALAKLRHANIDGALNKEELVKVCGLAQHERTPDIQALWRRMYDDANANEDEDVYKNVVHDSCNTLRMFAVDAFPRFLLSKKARAVNKLVREGDDHATKLSQEFARAGATLVPKNVDEWLCALIATIASWPACIVVADMTVAGAPMVYVNPMFCKTTGYTFDEAVGRNCRFLQGPKTEDFAKALISRTLAAAQDCHVLITNYKKSGSEFSNLLTLRPIFDADGVYRYSIGVQLEVTDEASLPMQLARLDKLLQLLPNQLPFRGDIQKSEHLPSYWLANEHQQSAVASSEISPMRIRPSASKSFATENKRGPQSTQLETETNHNDDIQQRFAFTKLQWLLYPESSLRAILADLEVGLPAFEKYLRQVGSFVTSCALDFVTQTHRVVNSTDDVQQHKWLVALHSEMKQLSFFYNTNTDIDLGSMDPAVRPIVIQDMIRWRDAWISVFARMYLRSFLDSVHGVKFFLALRHREVAAGNDVTFSQVDCNIKTVCSDKTRCASHETMFLDMLHVATFRLKNIGLVVSDMRVPGLPLIYISSGFLGVTGYGKEQVGLPCSFLQGKNTQPFIVQEIIEALRSSSPFVCKLNNYTLNHEEFQCLLTLNPIHDINNGYVFQVGLQLNVSANHTRDDYVASLCAMADVACLLPKRISGCDQS